MERENIAAYTESGASFPAFISINRESDGRFTITARERGHNGEKLVTLEIPEAELGQFAEEIIDRLHGIEP